jgi:phospholipase B1
MKEFDKGFTCIAMHLVGCKCAGYPTEKETKELKEYTERYQKLVLDLANSGRYDDKDDFTVVAQPFA